jgi:hypothetical protein
LRGVGLDLSKERAHELREHGAEVEVVGAQDVRSVNVRLAYLSRFEGGDVGGPEQRSGVAAKSKASGVRTRRPKSARESGARMLLLMRPS